MPPVTRKNDDETTHVDREEPERPQRGCRQQCPARDPDRREHRATSRNWNGSSAQRGCELPEPPFAIDDETSSCGQPWRGLPHQPRRPQQRDQRRRPQAGARAAVARGPATSSPSPRATSRNAISGLFSSAIPADDPARGHEPLPPVRTARATSHVTGDPRRADRSRRAEQVPGEQGVDRGRRAARGDQLCAAGAAELERVGPVISTSARSSARRACAARQRARRKASIRCAMSGVSGPWSAYPRAQVMPRGEEVQLVAVVAVAARARDEHRYDDSSKDEEGGESEPRNGARRRLRHLGIAIASSRSLRDITAQDRRAPDTSSVAGDTYPTAVSSGRPGAGSQTSPRSPRHSLRLAIRSPDRASKKSIEPSADTQVDDLAVRRSRTRLHPCDDVASSRSHRCWFRARAARARRPRRRAPRRG